MGSFSSPDRQLLTQATNDGSSKQQSVGRHGSQLSYARRRSVLR